MIFILLSWLKNNVTSEGRLIIRKYFLAFISLKMTSVFLLETFLEQLEQMGLAIENLRCQGEDKGITLKEKENCLQNSTGHSVFLDPRNVHSLK